MSNSNTEWTTEENSNMVSRADGIKYAKQLASEEGISGCFKVFYDGREVASPNDLPEQVDKTLIAVSAVYSQAVAGSVTVRAFGNKRK